MKFRLCFALLLSAAVSFAQSDQKKTDHKQGKTQAQYLDDALTGKPLASSGNRRVAAASSSGSVMLAQPASDTLVWGNRPAVPVGWATTATAGDWWNGRWVILNDHTAGLETRPLDDKGPTLTQVDYSAVNLDQAKLAPASYIQLAKAVQLESPATDEAEMLQTIYDHHFRVYDFEKVDQYLYRQALKQGTRMRWVWKPMRDADLKQVLANPQASGLPSATGIVYSKLYAQRIPARILEDAKCVLDDVKDAVFLVSDYEVVRPDPFLAVTTPKLLSEGKLWIVDRWDEPGFEDSHINNRDVVRTTQVQLELVSTLVH